MVIIISRLKACSDLLKHCIEEALKLSYKHNLTYNNIKHSKSKPQNSAKRGWDGTSTEVNIGPKIKKPLPHNPT